VDLLVWRCQPTQCRDACRPGQVSRPVEHAGGWLAVGQNVTC
jgi:hypothetical protein